MSADARFPEVDPRTAPRMAKGIILAHQEGRAPGLNRAVKDAGGTGNYITKAVKNRKGYNEGDDF